MASKILKVVPIGSRIPTEGEMVGAMTVEGGGCFRGRQTKAKAIRTAGHIGMCNIQASVGDTTISIRVGAVDNFRESRNAD